MRRAWFGYVEQGARARIQRAEAPELLRPVVPDDNEVRLRESRRCAGGRSAPLSPPDHAPHVRRRHRRTVMGSNASRMTSPSELKQSEAMKIAAPVARL